MLIIHTSLQIYVSYFFVEFSFEILKSGEGFIVE
jgi:hypothetical protein